jgi:hypothetical protein
VCRVHPIILLLLLILILFSADSPALPLLCREETVESARCERSDREKIPASLPMGREKSAVAALCERGTPSPGAHRPSLRLKSSP